MEEDDCFRLLKNKRSQVNEAKAARPQGPLREVLLQQEDVLQRHGGQGDPGQVSQLNSPSFCLLTCKTGL